VIDEPGTEPTGIRNPDQPDQWSVPPWPPQATVGEVVRHFSRFPLRQTASSAALAAYYQGYAAVLAKAPTYELQNAFAWEWYQSLLRCVADAAASAEAEHHASLKEAQASMQLTLVRTLGLNSQPIPGQAD
jgi:hypothetical protein